MSLDLGIQSHNLITDKNPFEGFAMIKRAGFSCCDFSLNKYLNNEDIYQSSMNHFFDQSVSELEAHFLQIKNASIESGVHIHQIHMPYPSYVPRAEKAINSYLQNQVATKSIEICRFLNAKYIVIHGFKLEYLIGSEESEWNETQKFIDFLAPLAIQYGITICIENLYHSVASHLVEGPSCDAIRAASRIDEMNQKYGTEVLGFCFDTGHANLVGLDMYKFICILGKRLKVLHIHDNDGVRDLHQIPYTFSRNRSNKSSTDWDGFLDGLRAINYQGVLSFETSPVLDTFPEDIKEEVLSFIASIGRHFSREICKSIDE